MCKYFAAPIKEGRTRNKNIACNMSFERAEREHYDSRVWLTSLVYPRRYRPPSVPDLLNAPDLLKKTKKHETIPTLSLHNICKPVQRHA